MTRADQSAAEVFKIKLIHLTFGCAHVELITMASQGNRCHCSRELSHSELLKHCLRLLPTLSCVWKG